MKSSTRGSSLQLASLPVFVPLSFTVAVPEISTSCTETFAPKTLGAMGCAPRRKVMRSRKKPSSPVMNVCPRSRSLSPAPSRTVLLPLKRALVAESGPCAGCASFTAAPSGSVPRRVTTRSAEADPTSADVANRNARVVFIRPALRNMYAVSHCPSFTRDAITDVKPFRFNEDVRGN